MGTFLQKLLGKKKTLRLEFCQNNLDRFLDEEAGSQFQKLFKEKSVSVKEFQCLSHCTLCEEKPYVIANGKQIVTKESLELLEKLKAL